MTPPLRISAGLKIKGSGTPPALVHYGTLLAVAPVPLTLVVTQGERLCRVLFGPTNAKTLRTLRQTWPGTQYLEDQKKIEAWFKTHAKKDQGKPPLLLIGTPFQQRVWLALSSIPKGETITYSQLAKTIGNPRAARAVGTALGKNPLPFFLPCHRVVAAQGLGGFTGGEELKRRLLRHEGVIF